MIKKVAEGIFRWYCHPDFYPDIRGDLEEIYQKRLQWLSRNRADLYFFVDTLLLFRISLLRPIKLLPMINRDLLQNHARIAIRQMRNEMSYSLIKIGGFSLGVAACLLLIIFLRHELSYDKHYERVRDIYRMNVTWLDDNDTWVDFPAPVVDVLRNEYPEIEAAGRMSMPVSSRKSQLDPAS